MILTYTCVQNISPRTKATLLQEKVLTRDAEIKY